MKIILVTSQKGGSGKTMLAAHSAVEAERVGDAPAWVIFNTGGFSMKIITDSSF